MRYHNITKDDMLNGEGLRVVLWVSGCEHHCPNCQNPITWDPYDGVPFGIDARREIFDLLSKSYLSGLTLSGGDPMFPSNRRAILDLVCDIKTEFPNKNIWMYTGYNWSEVKDSPIMTEIDVLVDGKFIDALKDVNLPWRGSSNQRVIDVQKSLQSGKVVLYCD